MGEAWDENSFQEALAGFVPISKAAKPIYDGLRDAFAHGYDGYDILFDGQTLQIEIAWKRGSASFSKE